MNLNNRRVNLLFYIFGVLCLFLPKLCCIEMETDADVTESGTLLLGEVVNIIHCQDHCNYNGVCELLYKDKHTATDLTTTYDKTYMCLCHENFAGRVCRKCNDGYFGKDCKACPGLLTGKVCGGRGICDQGVTGTGKCYCDGEYTSQSNCTALEEMGKTEAYTTMGITLLMIAAILCLLMVYAFVRFPFIHFLPDSTAAIILGLGIGLVFYFIAPKVKTEFLGSVLFDPHVFFLIFLPPIMFDAGFSLDKITFFRNFGTILIFAVVGTLWTAFLFGGSIYLIGYYGLSYQLEFMECMMYGALISSTDPVATLAIFKALNVDNTLYMLVFGESALNDAVAISLFKVFATFPTSKTDFFIFEPLLYFVGVFILSIIVGVSIGILASLLFKHLSLYKWPRIELALFLIFAYIPFVLCEGMHLSGILGVLFCGMIMSHYAHYSLGPMSQITTKTVCSTGSFASETFCFVYLGITLPLLASEDFQLDLILWSILLMLISRGMSIFPLSSISNIFRKIKINFKYQIVMWISGLRGAVSFCLALMIPTDNHSKLMYTCSMVILFSIIILGGSTQPLLHCMGVKNKATYTSQHKTSSTPRYRAYRPGLFDPNHFPSEMQIRKSMPEQDEGVPKIKVEDNFILGGGQKSLTGSMIGGSIEPLPVLNLNMCEPPPPIMSERSKPPPRILKAMEEASRSAKAADKITVNKPNYVAYSLQDNPFVQIPIPEQQKDKAINKMFGNIKIKDEVIYQSYETESDNEADGGVSPEIGQKNTEGNEESTTSNKTKSLSKSIEAKCFSERASPSMFSIGMLRHYDSKIFQGMFRKKNWILIKKKANDINLTVHNPAEFGMSP